jgi:ABC-type glycerol-3-phosphate transport system substrate-binding protein
MKGNLYQKASVVSIYSGYHKYLFYSLIIALLCGLIACQQPGSPTPEPQGIYSAVTDEPPTMQEKGDSITLTFACPQPYRHAMEELAREFHSLNPTIYVKVVAVEDLPGFDWRNDPRSAESAYPIVSGADTAMWLVVPQAAQVGFYRDLSAFIDGDAASVPEDFFPYVLEAYKWGGKTYALPTQVSLTPLFFNKRAFDDAGLSYPALDWTFDDFLVAAQALTVREDNAISRYGFVDFGNIGIETFILSRVGDTVDETGRPALETAALVEAMQWYRDLVFEHAVMPLPEVAGKLDKSNLIRTGGVAMWTDAPVNYDYYSMDSAVDVGVAPLPVASQVSGSHYPGRLWGYMVSAGTPYPQESWRWLRFLTHRTPSGICSDCLPARRSVAEATVYWSRFSRDMAPAMRQMAEHLYFPPSPAMTWYVQQAVSQVINGTAVDTALYEAQQAALDDYEVLAEATPRAVVMHTAPANMASARPQILFAAAPQGDVTPLRELAVEFNAGQTDFEVKIVPPAEQPRADCFSGMQSIDFAEARSTVRNLQPLLEADKQFSLDDFPSYFLEAYRYQGALWGLPIEAQVRVLYYNRDHFDSLGVAYPELEWTTAEFLDRALALHRGGRYGYLPLDGEIGNLLNWLTLLGGYPWDAQGQPRFDAPEVVAAMHWYADLAQRHNVMPALLTDDKADRDARLTLVRAGEVSMWSHFSGAIPHRDFGLADAAVKIAPLPAGTDKVSDFLYEGLFITANSTHVEQCWAWMKFVSENYIPLKGIPARNSILTSPDFARQVGSETQAVYMALLNYTDTSTLYAASARGKQSPYLLDALVEILNGASPESALSAAQYLAMQQGEN